MSNTLLYFSTAATWLTVCALAWQASRTAQAGRPVSPGALRAESVLVPAALVLHGMLIFYTVPVAEGLDLGVGNAISLLAWLAALVYGFARLVYPGLATLQGIMAPVALVAVLMQVSLGSRHIVNYEGAPLFTAHLAIAMLAYSLFIVATIHALMMLALEKWLKRGTLPPMFRNLPPLLEMEALLFRILLAAFVLLTLTLVTGVFFSEQLFGRPYAFTHKTVFGVISWFIYGGLLAGHHLRGWRGKIAVYWTLAGFALLLLSYVGSKFVLEIILKRG